MDKFEVGDTAIIVGGSKPNWIGCEVEILSELQEDPCAPEYLSHRITKPQAALGARSYWALPQHLRKKKPKEQLGDWDRIEELTRWNPTVIRA